mmetsp:Transcript_12727/g.19272  ORF Transcript_12727/g.19272 Transcript_12727/m.19272 type:complete len:239 (+) Transcript_12727:113-829(+)
MSSSYYFASRSHGGNATDFDGIPEGAELKDFFSRPVSGHSYSSGSVNSIIDDNGNGNGSNNGNGNESVDVDANGNYQKDDDRDGSGSGSGSGSRPNKYSYKHAAIEQKVAPQTPGSDPPTGLLLLCRKVPMKVEPKGMFAVERTFMQWMHTSLWLLAASLTIISYSNNDPIKLLYGAFIFPVALSFTVYSLYQFRKRVLMLRVKSPGPYEDTWGPVVLTIMLMSAIIAQFVTKIVYLF